MKTIYFLFYASVIHAVAISEIYAHNLPFQNKIDLISLTPSTPSVYTHNSTTVVEPEMIFIQGGTFKMGSNDYDNEQLVHPVTLNSYSIGKFEVTVKEYMVFVNETQSHFPEWLELNNNYNIHTGTDGYYKKMGDALQNEKSPIVGISWHDAVAYCEWLSNKTGKKFRLPTEAEWEYAAKGGSKARNNNWAGTSDTFQLQKYANFCDKNCKESWVNKTQNDGFVYTAPVGQFLPNELEIYDMSGNVKEWCSDWYGTYLDYALKNPTGATSGSYRVIRGGSWNSIDAICRVTTRSILNPSNKDSFVGFRVVRED